MIDLAATVQSLKNGSQLEFEQIRLSLTNECPNTMKALRLIDLDNSNPQPKRRKGFNLVPVPNKKMGVVLYVRYSHEGKILPSKWCTHTNDPILAEQFARNNKERLVQRYLQKRNSTMFKILDLFFKPCSEYFASEERWNRPLSDQCRNDYNLVIKNRFVPFLKEHKITSFDQITLDLLTDFQNFLSLKGRKPQSVNNDLKAVKRVMAYAARKKLMDGNPAAQLRRLPVHERDQTARGCYDLDRVKGVFQRQWPDKKAYLLCLLIYTTGLRDIEIRQLKKTDIILISNCHFIDISKSKTPNGIRKVPLHDFVYRRLISYANATGRDIDAPLFDIPHHDIFSHANLALARRLNASKEELERENITFYSGRHFWKTLMSSEGLGEDIEEIFMGHKVSSDVKKRYNHRDKQGKKLVVKKAKQIFAILDRCLFAQGRRKKQNP